MTLKEAKKALAQIGMTLHKTEHGEFRVNAIGASEAKAYYTSDLYDAVMTAKYIALYEKESKSNA